MQPIDWSDRIRAARVVYRLCSDIRFPKLFFFFFSNKACLLVVINNHIPSKTSTHKTGVSSELVFEWVTDGDNAYKPRKR